jgi:hypothetical protein
VTLLAIGGLGAGRKAVGSRVVCAVRLGSELALDELGAQATIGPGRVTGGALVGSPSRAVTIDALVHGGEMGFGGQPRPRHPSVARLTRDAGGAVLTMTEDQLSGRYL